MRWELKTFKNSTKGRLRSAPKESSFCRINALLLFSLLSVKDLVDNDSVMEKNINKS